jgi:hypothetical protein
LLFESKESKNILRQLPKIGVGVRVGVVVFVAVGDDVMVGVVVLGGVGVVVGERNGIELQLRETNKKADRPSNIAFNKIILLFIILVSHDGLILYTQRLMAQALGNLRLLITILAG